WYSRYLSYRNRLYGPELLPYLVRKPRHLIVGEIRRNPNSFYLFEPVHLSFLPPKIAFVFAFNFDLFLRSFRKHLIRPANSFHIRIGKFGPLEELFQRNRFIERIRTAADKDFTYPGRWPHKCLPKAFQFGAHCLTPIEKLSVDRIIMKTEFVPLLQKTQIGIVLPQKKTVFRA